MATSYGASAPLLGPSGLIVGYSGQKPKQSSQSPIYGANGLLTSYSTGANNSPDTQTNPYLVANPNDPTQKYNFSPTTGLNPQGLTKGQQAAADYQAGTQTVSNTKSAPIAAAASTTLNNENALQTGVVKSFNDYLTEAKQLQQQGSDQVKADTATLAAAPAQLQSNLSDAVKQFASTTGALDSKVTDINAANAATVNTNIAQSKQNITDYQTAANAVAQNATNAALSRIGAQQSTGGTPTSASGYGAELAAATTAGIQLPVAQQIAQMTQQNLQGYISPQQQNLYAQNISQVTGLEMPIAQTLVQYGIQNAGQVAQLQAQLAGRSLSEQIQFLTSLGIPIQLAQQVAQSLPSAISQLGGIDQSNTFYGLAQDYQNPVATGLPTYNPGVPAYGGNRNSGPYPNTGPVQSNNNGGYLNTNPGQPGAPVGVNNQGQLVDAQGNVVNYAPPVTPSATPGAVAPYGSQPWEGAGVYSDAEGMGGY